MPKRYTIGGLAKEIGVATSTLRYYERVGLLKPTGRTAHNYRYYGKDALERLRFIRAAQGNGFTLDDISGLLSLAQSKIPPCEDVQVIIEERLCDVERRLKDLRHLRGVLLAALESCQSGRGIGKCRVIDTLKDTAASGNDGLSSRGRKRRAQKKI